MSDIHSIMWECPRCHRYYMHWDGRAKILWCLGSDCHHLISCDRCRKAHIEYRGWWEPLPMVRVDGVTITKPSAGLASAIQRARGGPAPPMVQRGFA